MIDATDELAELRARQAAVRRRPFRRSKLARYRAELVALRRAGASYRELVVWLRTRKRCRICHTTVRYFLRRLPEMQHDDELRKT